MGHERKRQRTSLDWGTEKEWPLSPFVHPGLRGARVPEKQKPSEKEALYR